MKIDLVMWSKNGGETLGKVLNRINKVVPKECVNNRFVVNDHSTDATPYFINVNGWTQIVSDGQGISDAANCALKHVETAYFASFEQDLFLASNWWKQVSPLIFGESTVAAACGLRFLPKDNLCFNVDPYTLARQNQENLCNFGKTLDNTIWNTALLRECGGFPKLKHAGIDTYLLYLFNSKGYRWRVNYDVKSLHLHQGFLNELHHYYFYGRSLPDLYTKMAGFSSVGCNQSWFYYFKKFVASPVSGLKMGYLMRDGRLMLAYPAVRLCWLLGYLRGLEATA